jgi:arylsulfatase A-like enzyme
MPRLPLSAALLSAALLAGPAPAADPAKPNFVVIFIDDMGLSDLGCCGSKFYETPRIDRLAAEGMRFTTAYSACTVCSPTRAALMTGRNPARVGITDWIPGHRRPYAKLSPAKILHDLPAAEVTLAEALKPAGYASAAVGKWHLGGEGSLPTDHGFDVNIAGDHRGQPPSYFAPYKIPTLTEGPQGEYLTDRLTTEAVKYIEAHRDKPFLLYLPHYTVHTPLQAKPELVAKYKAKAKPDDPHKNAVYAAMIEDLDTGVGRILDKLEELKIADRTVVIFTSDNGGLMSSTTNLGVRAGKGSAYEGGVRIPLIVRWPGVVKAGTTADEPVITMDLTATILDIAGVAPPAPLDGVSLAGRLKGGPPPARDNLYWHYPHYHPGGATPHSAVRVGDEKLIEFYEDGRLELYDLKADPLEKQNLAETRKDRAAELRRRLEDWRKSVNAAPPTANPDYDPKRTNQAATKKAAKKP